MFLIKVLTREWCWKFSNERVTIWFTPQPALRVLFLIFQTGFNCDCLTYLKETYHSVQRTIAELAELSTAYWSAREQMGRQVGKGGKEGGRCSVCQCLFSWLFSKMTTKRSLSCFPLNRKKQTSCKGANSKKNKTWAGVFSFSCSLVPDTMRAAATSTRWYWLQLCLHKMWKGF